MDKSTQTFSKISSFMFHRRKKMIQVCHEGEEIMTGIYILELNA